MSTTSRSSRRRPDVPAHRSAARPRASSGARPRWCSSSGQPDAGSDREEVAFGAEHLVGPFGEVVHHVLDVVVQQVEGRRCRILEEALESVHLGPRAGRFRLRPPTEPLVVRPERAAAAVGGRLPVGGARQGLDECGTGRPELLGEDSVSPDRRWRPWLPPSPVPGAAASPPSRSGRPGYAPVTDGLPVVDRRIPTGPDPSSECSSGPNVASSSNWSSTCRRPRACRRPRSCRRVEGRRYASSRVSSGVSPTARRLGSGVAGTRIGKRGPWRRDARSGRPRAVRRCHVGRSGPGRPVGRWRCRGWRHGRIGPAAGGGVVGRRRDRALGRRVRRPCWPRRIAGGAHRVPCEDVATESAAPRRALVFGHAGGTSRRTGREVGTAGPGSGRRGGPGVRPPADETWTSAWPGPTSRARASVEPSNCSIRAPMWRTATSGEPSAARRAAGRVVAGPEELLADVQADGAVAGDERAGGEECGGVGQRRPRRRWRRASGTNAPRPPAPGPGRRRDRRPRAGRRARSAWTTVPDTPGRAGSGWPSPSTPTVMFPRPTFPHRRDASAATGAPPSIVHAVPVALALVPPFRHCVSTSPRDVAGEPPPRLAHDHPRHPAPHPPGRTRDARRLPGEDPAGRQCGLQVRPHPPVRGPGAPAEDLRRPGLLGDRLPLQPVRRAGARIRRRDRHVLLRDLRGHLPDDGEGRRERRQPAPRLRGAHRRRRRRGRGGRHPVELREVPGLRGRHHPPAVPPDGGPGGPRGRSTRSRPTSRADRRAPAVTGPSAGPAAGGTRSGTAHGTGRTRHEVGDEDDGGGAGVRTQGEPRTVRRPPRRGVDVAGLRVRPARPVPVGAPHRLPGMDRPGPGGPSDRGRADAPRRVASGSARPRCPDHVRNPVRRAERAVGGGPTAGARQRGARRVHQRDRAAHPRTPHLPARAVRRPRLESRGRGALPASSSPAGCSTAGPTNRTSAGRWAGRVDATGWARRRCSTAASGRCRTWWASGWHLRTGRWSGSRSPGCSGGRWRC